MLTRTIILQHTGSFALFAQHPGRLSTERFVNTTLQSRWFQADLPEHRQRQLNMNGFTTMRSARERNFLFGKAEPIGRA